MEKDLYKDTELSNKTNNNKKKKKDSNIHIDHRKRVRERFIKEGSLDSFEYHQIIELLLFFTIPRRDTNVIAHKLLDEYGSFHNLLNAKPEDLMKRCNLSQPTAVLISMIPYLSRKYLNSRWDKNVVIDNSIIASEYFGSLLLGQPFESFYMLYLDTRKRLNKSVKISEGNNRESYIYVDKIVDYALLYKACFVVMGHNHPSGTLKPSPADVNATKKVIEALEIINVRLLDHIIVCGEKNYSFADRKLLHLAY